MTIKTIFLDRDGVINKDTNYVYKIDEFEFINGIFKTCQYFLSINYQIIIVTNQSGIARGYFSEKDFQNLTKWMISQFKINGVNIIDLFYCPHSSDSNCNCRKPKPGMFIKAKNKHNIEFEKSWMIGDSERDIKAANLAGIKNTILVKTQNKMDKEDSHASFLVDSIEQTRDIILF
jgi:D-glycero-D-manno-heptose 1,7-bisphosphate phosphatase